MDRITKIEQENNFTLPESYKKLLVEFDLFMELDFKGKDMDIMNKNLITETIKNNQKSFQAWEYVKVWIFEDDRIQNNTIKRNDSDQMIDAERVKNTFMFGSYGDGVRLYFDIQDNMSVWQYWMDEGSVGKVADNFDEIIQNSEIIESE